MNPNLQQIIEQAVEETAKSDDALILASARAEPKAWGRLAAQGVLRFKAMSGRTPRGEERRAIWQRLWREVEKAREIAQHDG